MSHGLFHGLDSLVMSRKRQIFIVKGEGEGDFACVCPLRGIFFNHA